MRYLVKMKTISKSFGEVKALHDVDFYVKPGEIVGLVGDNGAGKSTLIKILMGVYPPDNGEIYFNGKKLKKHSVGNARKLKIEVVYQDNNLAHLQPIWRNIFIGREETTFLSFINIKKLKKKSVDLLREIGFKRDIDPDTSIRFLSGGERQGIALARAMYYESKLVVLDEPTTALSVKETTKTMDYIRELKRKGTSVIFITHNLYHSYPVADRFVILDRGRKIVDILKKDTSIEDIIKRIKGEVAR